jgi:hypothetical protein
MDSGTKPPGFDDAFYTLNFRWGGNASRPQALTIFGATYSLAYVATNGVVSFTRSLQDIYALAAFPAGLGLVLSPFWSDHDLTSAGNLYMRFEMVNTTTLAAVSADVVKTHLGSPTTFQATKLLMVTYYRVPPYGLSGVFNTYQVAVISDDYYTFLYYNYPTNGLQWTSYAGANQPVKCGFDNGDNKIWYNYNCSGTNFNCYKSLPTNSNCGVPGRYVWRVDGSAAITTPASRCKKICCLNFELLFFTTSMFYFPQTESSYFIQNFHQQRPTRYWRH